ncbi:hypothetical protein [Pelotalea chapellei]|uniref:Uncharacterized protein n=1 Tax=Pelotalea chapellei TaxID=44671 RepID=A0ABS5U9A8_9BACT|nr:hypothetical protein [Pelotalea chapellei]MBT1072262.1 hypothetical protein [Pelotalea chapellei]
MIEQYQLPLFLLNTLLVLLNASLGYHMAPRLLAGVDDPEIAVSGIRSIRGLLPAIVALYMFFNCLGYFQARSAYLLAVTALVFADLALQLVLRNKAKARRADNGEGKEEP